MAKKYFRKGLSLLLTLTMLLSVMQISAIAAEEGEEPVCGIPAHTHSVEGGCYETFEHTHSEEGGACYEAHEHVESWDRRGNYTGCDRVEHVHTEDCAYEIHAHTEDCYTEHEHDYRACYEWRGMRMVLVCGLDGQQELTCGYADGEKIHACGIEYDYTCETEYDFICELDEGVNYTLICQQEVHTHGNDCYLSTGAKYEHIDIRVYGGTYTLSYGGSEVTLTVYFHDTLGGYDVVVNDGTSGSYNKTYNVPLSNLSSTNSEVEYRLLDSNAFEVAIPAAFESRLGTASNPFSINGAVLLSKAAVEAADPELVAVFDEMFGEAETYAAYTTGSGNQRVTRTPAGDYYKVILEGYKPLANACTGTGSSRGYDFEIDISELGVYLTDALALEKVVVDENGSRLTDETEFTFTVEGPNDYRATVTLASGESETLTELTSGLYTITETAVEGYKPVNLGADGVLGEGDYVQTVQSEEKEDGEIPKVVFYNLKEETLQKLALLKIQKTVQDNTVSGSYADETYAFELRDAAGGLVKAFTLGSGEELEIAVNNNTVYTIAEIDPAVGGDDTLTVSVSGADLKAGSCEAEITVSGSAVVEFTNTYTSKPGSLKIVKTASGAEVPADTGFTVTGPNDYSLTVTYSQFTDGVYTIEGLAPGEYTVTEDTASAQVSGYTLAVSGSGETAEVEPNQTAEVTITNTYTLVPIGSLQITKTADGAEVPADTVFTVTGPNSYSLTVTYSQFTDGVYTIEGLAPGEYTVTEDTASAQVSGYTLAVSGSGETAEVEPNQTAEVTITNTYTEEIVPPGSLKIIKVVAGAEIPAETVFAVSGPNGYETAVTYAQFENGAYVLDGLTPGQYTVTEDSDSAQVSGYDLAVSGSGETAEVASEKTAEVTITNTYTEKPVTTGSLKIVKTASGAAVPAGTGFTVTGPDGYRLNVTYAQFENGVYTIDDLTPGQYTVTEDAASAQVSGYELTVSGSGAAAQVEIRKTAEVTITNTYAEEVTPPGKLQIVKTIVGLPAGAEIPKDTRFDIIDANVEYPNDSVVETVYWKDFNASGFIILELPVGQYTVVEDLASAAVDGYGTPSRAVVYDGDAANRFATVVSGEMARAEYTNSYEKVWTTGSLTITKSISGLDPDTQKELEKELSFTVTGEDGFEKTVSYEDFRKKNGVMSYTLSDLAPGTYTIVEEGAEVEGGYELSVSAADADPDADGYQVEVAAGETPVTFRIVNDYASRIYNVWFEGGVHGTVEKSSGDAVSGVWRNRWLEIGTDENEDDENDHIWSSSVLNVGTGVYTAGSGTIYDGLTENPVITEKFDATDRPTRLVLYTFTWGQWATFGGEMEFQKPGLEVEDGWQTTGEFYIPGTDVKFTGIEDAVDYMNDPANGVEPDANGIYNVLYMPLYEQKTVQQQYGSMYVGKLFEVDGEELTAAPAGFNGSFQLQKLEDGQWTTVQTVAWSQFDEYGAYAFENIETGTYRIVETDGALEGYDWSGTVTYYDDSGENTGSVIVDADEGVEVIIENRYTSPFIPGPGPGPEPGPNPEPGPGPGPEPGPDPEIEIEIPDEPTPLSDLPEEDVPLEDLPDEDVPLADIPKTGDDLLLYLFLTALSGAGLLWLALSGKKREEELA